jgi:hypothetical protein
MRPGRRTALAALAVLLVLGRAAQGQVAPAADAGGLLLSAGGTASAFDIQYGQRKMLGPSAFFDADLRRHVGMEGEARWLVFRQRADVHESTYSIGPRGFWRMGNFEPYAKALVGIGEFNYPYNYAHGSYLVFSPGAGVDYRISHRIRLRLADFEYQYWPEFFPSEMSSFGASTGIRIRIF